MISLVIVTCHFSIVRSTLTNVTSDQATLRRVHLHLTVQRLRAPRQDTAALDGRKTYPKTRTTSNPIPIYVLNQIITPTPKPTYSQSKPRTSPTILNLCTYPQGAKAEPPAAPEPPTSAASRSGRWNSTALSSRPDVAPGRSSARPLR